MPQDTWLWRRSGALACPAGLPFGFPRQLARSGARATGHPCPGARGGVPSPPLRAALARVAASASRLYGPHDRAESSRQPVKSRWCWWLPAAAGLWCALSASAQQALSESPQPLYPGAPLKLWETEKIADDLYGFRYSVYRQIFLVTDEGVIATDPINLKAATILREEIRKITRQPVKYVAYSHSHWDHIAGGKVFKDEGAQFIAQEQCAANLRENPGRDVVMPDTSFTDRYRIALGGKSLEMFYFGPSHDNCLVVMLVRPANMLFVVDVANPPYGWHMPYNPTFSEDRVWNMVPFLGAVEDLIRREGVQTIIGGHVTSEVDPRTGRPVLIRGTVGPAATVGERRMFLQAAIEAVRAELAAGTPAAEVPDKLVAGRLLADRVIDYDPAKMRMLLTRMTNYAQTGE